MGNVALLVSRGIQGHFLLIWLAALALVLSWSFRGWKRPPFAVAADSGPLRPGTSDYVAGIAFLLFLALYLGAIFYRADFADFDHSVLTDPLVHHRDQHFPIWPTRGRFFPLGHQEFDLLRRVAPSPAGYHMFAVTELLLLLGGVFVILRGFRHRIRFFLLALVLLTPTVLIAFSGLVYPERNLLFLLAILALCVQRWTDRPTAWPLLGALVAAHFAMYYKEPTFLLVAGFASTRLLCAWATPGAGQPRSVRRTLIAHPLETGLMLLVGVFVVLYSATMLPYRSLEYATSFGGSASPMATLGIYLKSDPILVLFLLVLAGRAVRLVRTRTLPDPFWDALAVGGVSYLMVYIGLGMSSAWFLAPVDLIGTLFLAERARVAITGGRLPAIVPIGGACLVAIWLAATSWLLTIRTKNIVHGKSQLAEFVRRQADTASVPIHLFFPYSHPYHVMEFAAVLEWKGVRLTGAGKRAPIVLEGPHPFAHGRCSYRDLPCTSAYAPAPGAIVIVLPDDEPAEGGPAGLLPDGILMLTCEPFALASAARLRWFTPRLAPGAGGTSGRRDVFWAYAAIAPELPGR